MHTNGISGGLDTTNAASMLGVTHATGNTQLNEPQTLQTSAAVPPVAPTPQGQMLDSAVRAAEAFHRRAEAKVSLAPRGFGTGAGGAAKALESAGIGLTAVGSKVSGSNSISNSSNMNNRETDADPLGRALGNAQRTAPASGVGSQGLGMTSSSKSREHMTKASGGYAGGGSVSAVGIEEEALDLIEGEGDSVRGGVFRHVVRAGGELDYDADSIYESFGAAAHAQRDGGVLVPQPAHDVFARGAAAYRAAQMHAGGAGNLRTATGYVRPGAGAAAACLQSSSAAMSTDPSIIAEAAAAAAASRVVAQTMQWGVESGDRPTFIPGELSAPPPPVNFATVAGVAMPPRSVSAISRAATQPMSRPANKILAQSSAPISRAPTSVTNHPQSKYAMVGGVLVDVGRLQNIGAKCDNAANNKSKGSTAQTQAAAQAAKRKASTLDAEIDALLARKSTHAAEAQDEAFKTTLDHLENLSKREYMTKKENQITFVQISGYWCSDCGRGYGDRPPLCMNKGHRLLRKPTVKRFWECNKCGKREVSFIEYCCCWYMVCLRWVFIAINSDSSVFRSSLFYRIRSISIAMVGWVE